VGWLRVALSQVEDDTFKRLWSALTKAQGGLKRLDSYYEGTRRLQNLGLAVPPALETVRDAGELAADHGRLIEQRCDVEGFRLPGQESADDDLWGIWQANDLDEESQLGHLDSMALSRAYVCLGAREDEEPEAGVPLITVESPLEMIHETDARTRQLTAALRRPSPTEATLYLPDVTIWLSNDGRNWTELDRDEHALGAVPVVPLVNRSRLKNRTGVSEMADVIDLTDAACRALTNAQVATEVLAVPQRYVLGAAPNDFVDVNGDPVPAWETYFGAVWALRNDQAKVGQFSAADLGNFERIINHYANLVSGVSGLPTRFYGQYTTNPPSEGSIIADESRLIMNAYRKHRALGGSWERVMRIARRIIDGDWSPDLARMETLWRNPETPTRAQLADAVVKLRSAGLLPVEAAWEELGYSATRREQLRRMRDAELAADPLKAAADAFANPITAPTDPAQVPAAQVPAFNPDVPGGVRA
jgi:hypothetical protein